MLSVSGIVIFGYYIYVVKGYVKKGNYFKF